MPEGSQHWWLPMKPERAEKLARLAAERGVRLTPPDASFVGGEFGGGVRLSVMAPLTRDELDRALRTIVMTHGCCKRSAAATRSQETSLKFWRSTGVMLRPSCTTNRPCGKA